MREVLEAFGFPAPFRAFIGETVYRDVLYRLKINGHVGAAHRASNSVRQGCPLSPLLFLLVGGTTHLCARGRAAQGDEGHGRRGERRAGSHSNNGPTADRTRVRIPTVYFPAHIQM